MRLPIRPLAAALLLAASAGAAEAQQKTETAIFAGGCFWCVESDFDKIPGVIETISGYTGGHVDNPTYQQVSHENTGHREAVRIVYDPAKVSYDKLLAAYFHSVDPTDAGGQFCDRGESYESAIFALDDMQKTKAEAAKAAAAKELGKEIATKIETAAKFYPAEGYHQDSYKKNPIRYSFYRWNCGRNQTVEEVWGDRAYLGIPKDHKKGE